MFYRNAQDLESMHSDGHVLHALLAFEDEIDGAGEQVDEGVPV